MAERKKYVTLFNPDNGTEVEVDEERAKVLKDRGYTDKKARNYSGPNSAKRSAGGQTDDTTVADLKARNQELENRLAALEGAQGNKQ